MLVFDPLCFPLRKLSDAECIRFLSLCVQSAIHLLELIDGILSPLHTGIQPESSGPILSFVAVEVRGVRIVWIIVLLPRTNAGGWLGGIDNRIIVQMRDVRIARIARVDLRLNNGLGHFDSMNIGWGWASEFPELSAFSL